MALTEETILNLLVRELNQEGNSKFKADVRLLWEFYSSKAELGGFMIQYLYTKVHAANYVMWQHYRDMDTQQLDVRVWDSQVFEHLKTLYTLALDSLKAETGMTLSAIDIRFGQLSVSSPYPYASLPNGFNPNSLTFRGIPSLAGEPADGSW